MTRIVGRRPLIDAEGLVAGLRVPPHFDDATFASYRPDPNFPSQSAARAKCESFAAGVRAKRKGASAGKGLYIDGGFGVGKTHLLAAIAAAAGGPSVFGTFVEYTHVVGALGFAKASATLAAFSLVCIDEFELDDPGDTLIMARLMRELSTAGVAIAATSNTLPESLGEGRFAAEDFRREIQSVAAVFETVTIDGPDYRHRGAWDFTPSTRDDALAATSHWGGYVEPWPELLADLAKVHPSQYREYVAGVRVLGLTDVATLEDHNEALRLVSLVDRLYDANARIIAHGRPWGDVFTDSMLRSGYRKKYFRALSRLAVMSESDAGRATSSPS